MRPFLLAAILLLPATAHAQSGPVTPMQKLPPANPLPYEDADAQAVMAPVQGLMAALDANDGAAVLKLVLPEGGATAVWEGANGQRGYKRVGWAEYAAQLKPDGDRFQERLGTPAIEVDGDIAMVWVPFTVVKNGKPDSCGMDHFDLIRTGGVWKILNATWSTRTTGCAAQ